jgi:hypothetical protein
LDVVLASSSESYKLIVYSNPGRVFGLVIQVDLPARYINEGSTTLFSALCMCEARSYGKPWMRKPLRKATAGLFKLAMYVYAVSAFKLFRDKG